jgi:hypothetical protein
LKNLFVSILASAIIAGSLLWYYDQHVATKIAVIDMDGYVNQLRSDYIQGKLTKEQLDVDLQRLSGQIKEKYSSNTILLLKEVVVNGNVENFSPENQSE